MKCQIRRTERGWPGHFICAYDCVFRRNTLLECGDTRIVISTVGRCHSPSEGKFTKLGLNRYYETMVFHAMKELNIYWDADVGREIKVLSKCAVDHIEVHADQEANDMHEDVVKEITERIKKGEIK